MMSCLASRQLLSVTLLLLVVQVTSLNWPDGKYGLPMADKGCPEADGFNWVEGSRLQETESGSHASDPVHLAGIKSTESDTVLQKFCIKKYPSADSDGTNEFMPGSYCVYKKGDCPAGFRSGEIYWDDAAQWFGTTEQTSSGVLPDGTYDRNTLIEYCCRTDASTKKAIKLPTSSPFYLFRLADRCQEVEGMDAHEEWVYWADEDLVTNFGYAKGLYPKMIRNTFPTRYTKLYYCYYTPQGPNKTLKTVLTVLYVIAGIAGGIILICLALCVIQRLIFCLKKDKECEENNADNIAREHMLDEPRGASGAAAAAIYRPIATSSTSVSTATSAEAEPLKKADLRKDGPQIVVPPRYSTLPSEAPRYSTLPGAAPPVETPEDGEPYVAVLPENTPMSQPPSYEEVLREDGKAS